MYVLLQGFCYALRALRRNPGFTTLAVLSLAIGIGATAVVFSVADAVLFRPLPFADSERLVSLWSRSPGVNIEEDWLSPGQYLQIKTQNHVFQQMAIAIGETHNLTGRARAERIEGARVSSSFLPMLGARPLLGRLILPEEDQPGKPATAVLSHSLWTRVFGADPGVVGKTVTLDGTHRTIVGVVGPEFRLSPEVMPTGVGADRMELFLPLPFSRSVLSWNNESYNVIARLRTGASVRQAQADIDVIAARIREQDKRDGTFTISVVPLLDQAAGKIRLTLLTLLASVVLVLLITSANLAHLQLSRAAVHQREIAIRIAIGVGRGRLVSQFLSECIVLALLGGAAGLILAFWSLHLLRVLNPGNIPRIGEIGIGARVLVFSFGISVMTGVLFGLPPILQATKLDLNSALKSGRRALAGGAVWTRRDRLRRLLVVSQFAISLMLLIGAGLLIRSFVQLQRVQPGFTAAGVISLRLSIPEGKSRATLQRLWERLDRLPGVKAYGAVSALPLAGQISWGILNVDGYVRAPGESEIQADQRVASTGYFRAMEISLRRGRFFSERDTAGSEPVAIVDENMARRLWPNSEPLGKRIRGPESDEPWRTVVGVIGNVKQYGLDSESRMVAYYPDSQVQSAAEFIVVRTAADPAGMERVLTREILTVDPDLPVFDIRTMQARLDHSLARRRFSMLLLGASAGFALVLAMVGVYGVMSYLVSHGTHEIGIRMALGAQRGTIVYLIVRQGMGLVLAGVAVGLTGAFVLTHAMAGLLFGVSATDAATFSIVPLALATVGTLASYIPARRAARLDPLAALHCE